MKSEKSMEKVVSLCKNRGIIYPGSEIYGGLANTWDYGPLGVEFKNNVKTTFIKVVKEGVCVGSIPELFDSKTPYKPGGAISQAWSVSEILRIITD